jgi:hypothetical protein
MASTPDYTILHAPRISEAKFAAILRAGNSPAYPAAPACYRAAVARGVDPAVLLAVFRKESTYGRFGRARANRSWGNLRRSPDYPTVNAFVQYPSWEAGASDAARLLAIYGRNQIRKGTNTSTVQTMPYVWAPASDGNGPDRYGDQLARWIREWSGAAGDVSAAVAAVGTGSGSGSGTGAGKTTAASSGGTTMAEYLGVPADTIFTAELLETFIHKVRDATGMAGPYGEQFYRRIYGAYVTSKTRCGDITYKFDASGAPAVDVTGGIGLVLAGLPEAIGEQLRNIAVLAGILVLIILALSRLVR